LHCFRSSRLRALIFGGRRGRIERLLTGETKMTPLVLTLIGDDRPGLVNAVSQVVATHGGSWLESRLAHLSGKFAGIVLISAPEANADALAAALSTLDDAGLRVAVERGAHAPAPRAVGPAAGTLELEIVGHDRPGIVRDLTQTLKTLGVNIEEFSSGVESAAFSGVDMFRARARVQLPAGLRVDEVQETLERLAGEIMVDLTLGGEKPRP
jgi:glycine cleavage system regulatory protein